MDNKKTTKFEFLLRIGDNIICQRYFNVRSFKESNLRCLELHEAVKDISEYISDNLKDKSFEYLYDHYNYHTNTVTLSEQDSQIDENENFVIILKKNNDIVLERNFTSRWYPARIRYTVDIRPHIPYFLNSLSDILTRKKITRKYLQTTL